MPSVIHPHDALTYMEADVSQRPFGVRVLRLLRELSYLDGHLASSLRKAGEFPLVTLALSALVLILMLGIAHLPVAVSATHTDARDATPTVAPTLQAEQDAYGGWLHGAHAAVVAEATDLPVQF